MGMRVGPQRRLSTEELMLSNCVAGEDSALTENKLLNVLRWKISNMHKSGWSNIVNTHDLSHQLVSAISHTEPISNRSFFCLLSIFFFNTVGSETAF